MEIDSPSDCSEAATEPQGYSAPTPIPRRNLGYSIADQKWSAKLTEEAIVAKVGLGAERGLKVYFDSPTGDKHGEQSAETAVGAARSR